MNSIVIRYLYIFVTTGMPEVIMWWAEGRKKIGVIGYMIDCAQPTQGQGGRMEERL